MGSLTNALKLLSLLSEEQPVLRVGDAQRRTGIAKSSVSRTLKEMCDARLLTRESAGTGYVPGSLAGRLGSLYKQEESLLQLAELEAGQLIQRFGFVCYVGALSQNQFLLARRKHASQPLIMMWDVGQRAPLFMTAGGWAMLAVLPESRVAEIVRSEPSWPSSAAENRSRLKRIREMGGYFVFDVGRLGIGTVASAVVNIKSGECISFSLAFPHALVDAKLRKDMAEAVRQTASALGQQVNGPSGAAPDFAEVMFEQYLA
jgi:DNA-binding IclR family transcriptional regulator